MNLNTFISEEVTRQGFTGDSHAERSKYMLDAWTHAENNHSHDFPISIVSISTWGHLVEPDFNYRIGFRDINVRVGDRRCPDWEDVGMLMEFFVTSVIPSDTTPGEKYHIFELIHPFEDGNGRVGKIIYNYLRGTLNNPSFPPDFFGAGVP